MTKPRLYSGLDHGIRIMILKRTKPNRYKSKSFSVYGVTFEEVYKFIKNAVKESK